MREPLDHDPPDWQEPEPRTTAEKIGDILVRFVQVCAAILAGDTISDLIIESCIIEHIVCFLKKLFPAL